MTFDTLMYDLRMSSQSILVISLIGTQLTRHHRFVSLVH